MAAISISQGPREIGAGRTKPWLRPPDLPVFNTNSPVLRSEADLAAALEKLSYLEQRAAEIAVMREQRIKLVEREFDHRALEPVGNELWPISDLITVYRAAIERYRAAHGRQRSDDAP